MVIEIFKKRGRFFLVIIIALSFLLIALLVLYMGGLLPRSGGMADTPLPESSFQGDNSQESPFSEFLDKGMSYEDGVPSILNEPMRLALEFVTINKYSKSKEPILSDGFILVECISSKPEMSFELIASKDNNFKHVVGDVISFIPDIESDHLVIQDDDGGLYLATEVGNNNIKEILEPGNMLVFVCEQLNCADGVLSWALIFNDH